MKLFAKFFACVLLMDQVYCDDFDDFKVHVLGEIKTLKENNAKKDQEIASLKTRQEEMTSAIQNNIAYVDYLTYDLPDSTLMNVHQTCQELGSRGVDRSGSFPINPGNCLCCLCSFSIMFFKITENNLPYFLIFSAETFFLNLEIAVNSDSFCNTSIFHSMN